MPGLAVWVETEGVLGFVRTDNDALVACLGDPQRAKPAFQELLRRRDADALEVIRAGLRHEDPAVREGRTSARWPPN